MQIKPKKYTVRKSITVYAVKKTTEYDSYISFSNSEQLFNIIELLYKNFEKSNYLFLYNGKFILYVENSSIFPKKVNKFTKSYFEEYGKLLCVDPIKKIGALL